MKRPLPHETPDVNSVANADCTAIPFHRTADISFIEFAGHLGASHDPLKLLQDGENMNMTHPLG